MTIEYSAKGGLQLKDENKEPTAECQEGAEATEQSRRDFITSGGKLAGGEGGIRTHGDG